MTDMDAIEVAARWNDIAGLAWNIIPIDNNTLLRLRKGDGHMITKEAAERVIETIETNEALRAQLAAKDAEIEALKAGVQEALLVLEGEREALRGKLDTTLKALYDTTSTLETVIGTLQTERAWMRYAFAALRGLVDAGIITDAPVLAMAPEWLQDEPAPVVVEDAGAPG